MRWTVDTLRQIRPRHLWRALVDGKRAIRELKYRYTFTGKKEFCSFLTGGSKEDVQTCFRELKALSGFVQDITSEIERIRPGAGRGAMGEEAETLYVITRLLKPDIVLETGVGGGMSSAYILKAIQANGTGHLYSIDLPDREGLSGWAVPAELHVYWENHLGTSSDLMQAVLRKTGPISIFIHDSDHSYENMMFEFETVWPVLRSGGLFLAHDIGRNGAFFDFCGKQGVSWRQVRTFPVLGGFIKTEAPLH